MPGVDISDIDALAEAVTFLVRIGERHLLRPGDPAARGRGDC